MRIATVSSREKTGRANATGVTIDTYQGIQVLGLGTYHPQTYSQRELMEELGYTGDRFAERLCSRLKIDSRSFNKTLGGHAAATMDTLGDYHRQYTPEMAAEALRAAAGSVHDLSELDALIVATSTGFMMPGVAEVLTDTYGIGRRDSLRFNLVGQGCVAAVPALQVARGLIASQQARRVGVVCSEAQAALYNPQPGGKVDMIKYLLFGEGAAALILGDGCAPGAGMPTLVDSQQHMAAGVLDVASVRQGTNWEANLGESIPGITAGLLPDVINSLLARHALALADVRHWAFHTGGRKVLEVCQTGLGLTDEQMAPSYDVMRAQGNMNSCSVLFSLQRVIEAHKPQAGDVGIMVSVGPGLTVGAILMRWIA